MIREENLRIDVSQEMFEVEIISIIDGGKLISIEEGDTVFDADIWNLMRRLVITWDDAIPETVEENIEEIRRQIVMNAL